MEEIDEKENSKEGYALPTGTGIKLSLFGVSRARYKTAFWIPECKNSLINY